MRRIDAAIAIVLRENLLLICQRKHDDTFGGLWEFPGGKKERGETLEECLARELREELRIVAQPVHALVPVEHDYPAVRVRLHPFICQHLAGQPQTIECQQFRWIAPQQLGEYEFPPANESLLEEIVSYMSSRSPA